jgi:hypothetical protein
MDPRHGDPALAKPERERERERELLCPVDVPSVVRARRFTTNSTDPVCTRKLAELTSAPPLCRTDAMPPDSCG